MSNTDCMHRRCGALSDFPDSTGIDWSGGLNRINGNETLYLTLLHLFFESDCFDKLNDAFICHDYACARYEAHSMKGTAANLGFHSISQYADQLNCNLKNLEYGRATAAFEKLNEAYHTAKNAVLNLRQFNNGGA